MASTDLNRILSKVKNGETILRNEAYALGGADGDALRDMQSAALAVRGKAFGDIVTFSQNVFIPLTNICKDYCTYCTFRKDPHDLRAKIMTPEEVLSTVKSGQQLGCTEVLISMGDKADYFPEVREWLNARGYRNMPDYLAAICELIVRETGLLPHTNAGVLDRYHLMRLKKVNASMGIMLENISERLYGPGQVHENAPDKKPARRMRFMEEAGKLQIPFTTGILIGIGETWNERVDSLFAIKQLNDRYGHIQEVIIQNFRAKADTPMAGFQEPSLPDLIRTICAAIFIFQGSIHIQAPPNLNAGSLRELLLSGVDDWGGISPLTVDYINPEAPWPHREQLAELTRAAGYRFTQRLPIYPEYINAKFVHEDMYGYVQKLSQHIARPA